MIFARFCAALLVVFSLPCVAPAHADDVRAGEPHELWAGPPSPPPRALPLAPRPKWSRAVGAGIAPLVVDPSGSVAVLTSSGDLLELDANGSERVRTRMPSAISHGPLRMSSGDRVFITRSGECFALAPGGNVRFRRILASQERDAPPPPVATARGTLVVASGSHVLELDADGVVSHEAQFAEPPASLAVDARGAVVGVDASGVVTSWHAPGAPRRRGALGGALRGAAVISRDGESLLAVVDGSRVVRFDLASNTAATLARSDAPPFEGPPTPGPDGAVWVLLRDGTLLGLAVDGHELGRFAIPTGPAASRDALGGAGGRTVVVSDASHVAYARGDGALFVLGPSTNEPTAVTTCRDPISLVASRQGRLYVACRDGTVSAYDAR